VPSRAQPDGETIGWVSKVEATTIHVNSGPFGGGVVPLIVSRNTRIMVGSKEGWFEDIRPGGQVKVAYDMFEGRRMARSVEILVDEGATRLSRGEMRLKGTSGAVSAEPTPTVAKTPADGRPATSDKAAEPATHPAPVATSPTAPSTTSTEKHVPTPSGRTTPRPESARVPAAEATPRTTASPARGGAALETRAQETVRPVATTPPTARPEPVRNAEGGGTSDGSEAVDWLLKNRN
jgi:hypothetical protein